MNKSTTSELYDRKGIRVGKRQDEKATALMRHKHDTFHGVGGFLMGRMYDNGFKELIPIPMAL